MLMVLLVLGLMLLGAVILCIEMFMPSFGLIGITGIAMIIASFVMTVLYLPFGGLIVIAEAVVLAVVGFFVVKYIKRRQLYGKLILDETLNMDEREIGQLEFFMGKQGVTKTPLRPYGDADFNGTSVEVYSDGAYIPEGRAVRVVSISGQKIMVKAIQ